MTSKTEQPETTPAVTPEPQPDRKADIVKRTPTGRPP
jgi:hypothetical protein